MMKKVMRWFFMFILCGLCFFMGAYDGDRVFYPKQLKVYVKDRALVLGREKSDDTIDLSHVDAIETIHEVPMHLAVTEFTGGSHCCYVTKIYGFEKRRIHYLQTIDGQYGPRATLIHKNGRPYVQFFDHTFTYWKATYVDSPKAPVVLFEFKNNRYQMAFEAMREDPLSDREIVTKADGLSLQIEDTSTLLNEKTNRYFRKKLIEEMLALIYTGNHHKAKLFYESACRVPKAVKEAFLKAFYEKLSTSPYGRDFSVF